MTDGWHAAAQARNEFADLVEGLTADQIGRETLCSGWTPHEMTGHLVTFVDLPLPKFVFNIVRHRGDFDAASDSMARTFAQRPLTDLLGTLREKAAQKTALPTFPESMTVTDAIIHQQDVRRGVGVPGGPAAELVRSSLDFLTTHKRATLLLGKDGAFDGLRFEAVDIGWSHGSGPLVSGPGEAILMTAVRRDVSDELTGDGVAAFVSRTCR